MRRVAFLFGFLLGAALVVATAGPVVAGWINAQSVALAQRTTLPGR